jgi:hypothetical protein
MSRALMSRRRIRHNRHYKRGPAAACGGAAPRAVDGGVYPPIARRPGERLIQVVRPNRRGDAVE